MKVFVFVFAVSFSSFFSQCRSGKVITNAIAPRDSVAVVEIKSIVDSSVIVNSTRDIIQKNFIDFKTFSAKIKLDIDDSKGKKPDLLANIRMIKDSAI